MSSLTTVEQTAGDSNWRQCHPFGEAYQMRKGVCQFVKLYPKMSSLFDYFASVQATLTGGNIFLPMY